MLKSKYLKFPFFKQYDKMDCGPACLRMIAKYYGKDISLKEIRDHSFIIKTGVNLLGLSEAAETMGLRTTSRKISLAILKKNEVPPCILHWNKKHFVVLYKIKKKGNNYFFYVADPAYGLLKYSEEELSACWINTSGAGIEKGVVMFVEPTPIFYEKKPLKYESFSLFYLLKYLRPYKGLVFKLFAGLLIGSALQLIFPFLTQAIVDQGIQKRDVGLIQLVLMAQLMLVFSRTIIDVIRRWILLHISTRVNVSLISDFLVKLMKLPMRFFESKLTGDLIRRIEDHKRIEQFLTQSLLSVLFSFITIAVFSVVLVIYDIKIFFVFLIGSLLYFAWIELFMSKRALLNRKNFEQMAINQNNLIQLIHGMQEIKLTGCEQQKRWEWESIQAGLYKINVDSLSLSQWQQCGAVFINEIKNIVITIISALAVLDNSISLGMMLSVQYIIGQMQGPIDQFITFVQQAQDAKLSLERLGEIHGNENEEPEKTDSIKQIPGNSSLFLNDVSFTYNSSKSAKVLQNLSLEIPHGKTTAIVGLSGSGKTTLIKLMLGFYSPTEGDICLEKTSLQNISFKEWRKRCGVVMQEGYIFNDTIANNIAPGVEKINMEKLKNAAVIANISEYIDSLPLKYNTLIGSTGEGLSQGQKQRILIARAIYKDPEFIFFDEATNALDTNNEKYIVNNLNVFFKSKTVIVVAHRLSTVRNADQIVVLKAGHIIEKGCHQELIELQGEYYHLVKNQLDISC